MKGMDILELIDKGSEEIDEIIDNQLQKDKRYKEAEKKFLALIETLEKEPKLDIEGAESTMEAWAKDAAFNEGFKTGVRLMVGCMGEEGKA